MNSESRHELSLLEALEQDGRVTQRGLAAKLGIALGLTNMYLKRLVRKGCIKCVNVKANRLGYLITPTGLAEKTRLTYEYMEYSLRIFREGRTHLKAMLQPYASKPSARIGIFGTGDAAELAYLCLKELGLQPAVVFDAEQGGTFFGSRVLHIRDHASVEYDLLIVAILDRATEAAALLAEHGVPDGKQLALRPPNAASGRPNGSSNGRNGQRQKR